MFNVWDSRGQLIIILLIYLERTISCICGEVCSLIFRSGESNLQNVPWQQVCSTTLRGKWLLSSLSKWWRYTDPGRLLPEPSTACSHWLSLRAEWKVQLLVYYRGLGFPINGLIQSRLVSQPTCIHTPWDSSHSRALPNTPCLHWRTTTAHATVNLCSSFRTSASENRYTGK